jgi:dTDP-D-glucose 4,6-dehydratase
VAELGYHPEDDFERQFAEIVDWYLEEKRSGCLV